MPTVPQLDIPSFPSPPRQASRSPRGGGYRTATGFTPRGLLPRGADGVATSVARPGAAPLAASGSAAVLPRGSPSKGTPRRRVGGPASPRGSPRCSPRGAASGSGARAVRELADAGDSAHVFGGISELATDADAMKVSLQGWVQGYNAEVDSFPSVALFCEMKLAEATALHGDSRGPNAFRTAVACDLHGKVCSLFGRYRGLLGSMHRELISSIYPLDAAGDRTPRLTNADAVDVFTTAPYFVRSSELQQENSLMTGQLFDFRNKDDFLEKENLRRQFAVSFTVKMYGKKMRAQYFTRWKLITQSGNQYRMIIDSMGSKGRGKGKLGKCFHSWREQVVEHKIQALKNTIETSGKLDFEMQRTRDEQLSELHAKVNKMGDDGKTKEKQKAYLAKILITEHQERIKGRDSDVKSALLMGNLNEIMQEAKLEEMDMRKQVKMLNRATNEQYKRAREAAATKISTAYRGRQARAEVQDLRDQHAAADTIQARIRGRNERRAYKGRRAAYASALENDAHVPTSATDAQHVRTAIDVLLLELSEVKRSIATMPDATVLGFGVLDLGVMESDRCWATIRKWINWCLAQLNMESRKLSSKVDFKATFSDSEVLAALLEVVSPQIDGKSTVTEVRRQPTAVDRAKLITKRLTEMDGRHGLTAQHIVDGHAFDIQHTLGKLFIEFHSLPSISSARIDKNWQTLSVLETEWNVHRRKGWLTKTALGELKSAVRELLQEIAVLQEEFKDASKLWFNIEQSMVKFSWSLVDTKLETISSLMGTLDDDDAGDKQNTVGQTTAGVTGAVSGDLKAFGMADATPEEAKAELSLLSQELDTHGADLIKTFKHYAAKGTSHVSQISADDFKVFIAECKLPKNGISTAHIGVIFVTVNSTDQEAGNSAHHLIFREFTEAIVRVSAKAFEKGATIADKVRMFVQDHMIPYAQSSDDQAFSEMLEHPAVKAIFLRNHPALKRVFADYAKADHADFARKASMNMREFMLIIKDLRLHQSCGMTVVRAQKLFLDVQQGLDFDGDGEDNGFIQLAPEDPKTGSAAEFLQHSKERKSDGKPDAPPAGSLSNLAELASELDYNEFLLSICGMALFRYPDPFLPLYNRLEDFFSKDLTPVLSGAVKPTSLR